MPRVPTGSSIKAQTFLASRAGYQPNGKMSIVDRNTGTALLTTDLTIIVDSDGGSRQFGERSTRGSKQAGEVKQ
jgi:hypothetical protein